MNTLEEEWLSYAADHVDPGLPVDQRRALKRCFYSGAQSAALAAHGGVKPRDLLDEVRLFAHQIGKPTEV